MVKAHWDGILDTRLDNLVYITKLIVTYLPNQISFSFNW